jgi:hypothetical protein
MHTCPKLEKKLAGCTWIKKNPGEKNKDLFCRMGPV